MTNRYLGSNPLVGALLAPLDRLRELDPGEKVMAVLLAGVQSLLGDWAFLLVVVLIWSSMTDWLFGRAAARKRGDFDVERSAWGLQSKLAGWCIVGILWAVEAILIFSGKVDLLGFPTAAAALGLIFQDLDSIEEHRQELGSRPMPLLTAILAAGHRIGAALLPPPADAEDDGDAAGEAG